IQGGIFACDLCRSFADRDFGRLVEVECRRPDPDEVQRTERDGAVSAKYCDLDLLAGLGISGQDYAIGCVEAFNHWATDLPEYARHLSIHPDFGVVINDDFEC